MHASIRGRKWTLLFTVVSVLLLACRAQAVITVPTLRADYQFQNSLASSVPGASSLANLGPNTFGSATVDGLSRTVLNFAQNDGLALPTSGLISGPGYSIVILLAFNDVSSWRRIIDYKSAASDTGLYSLNSDLNFYNVALGSGAPITSGVFVQVVLTRDFGQNVVGYVNGVQQFSFVDSTDLALPDANALLRFFRDEDPVAPNEASSGSITRLRVYDAPSRRERLRRWTACRAVVERRSSLSAAFTDGPKTWG